MRMWTKEQQRERRVYKRLRKNVVCLNLYLINCRVMFLPDVFHVDEVHLVRSNLLYRRGDDDREGDSIFIVPVRARIERTISQRYQRLCVLSGLCGLYFQLYQ